MRRRLLRILPFLAVLLLAVVTAAVLAPSAMTKKEPPPPPPTPSGSFTLPPGAAIALTNMTLTSEDQAGVMVGVFAGEQSETFSLGDNSTGTGTEVALDDWGYVNQHSYPVTILFALADVTVGEVYLSNGTMLAEEGGLPPIEVTHASLGWTEDATQILLSMNDGSQNPTTDSIPALGAGNFNATIQLTAPEWPVTITNLTGYSDGPTVDESGNAMCGFHAVITYTGRTSKKATGATILLAAAGLDGLGFAKDSLGVSPFNPGTFNVLPTNLQAGVDYQFAVVIENSKTSEELGIQFGSVFRLDPTTFDGGCPLPGEIVSTDFGS